MRLFGEEEHILLPLSSFTEARAVSVSRTLRVKYKMLWYRKVKTVREKPGSTVPEHPQSYGRIELCAIFGFAVTVDFAA